MVDAPVLISHINLEIVDMLVNRHVESLFKSSSAFYPEPSRFIEVESRIKITWKAISKGKRWPSHCDTFVDIYIERSNRKLATTVSTHTKN